MRHVSKTILLTVAAIVLSVCFYTPAQAFWLSLPGVGVEVQGPRGASASPTAQCAGALMAARSCSQAAKSSGGIPVRASLFPHILGTVIAVFDGKRQFHESLVH